MGHKLRTVLKIWIPFVPGARNDRKNLPCLRISVRYVIGVSQPVVRETGL